MPAMAVVAPFPFTVPQSGVDLRVFCSGNPRSDLPGTSSGGPPLAGPSSPLLILTALLRGRPPLGDLAAVAGGPGHAGHRDQRGIVFGLVMYSVAPLGLGNDATNPWLPGAQIDPLVVLAWILLLGGPVAAAVIAGRRYRGPGGSVPSADARIGQGVVAGVLANLVGALLVAVLGTGTIALTIKVAWLRPWIFHIPHLQRLSIRSPPISWAAPFPVRANCESPLLLNQCRLGWSS